MFSNIYILTLTCAFKKLPMVVVINLRVAMIRYIFFSLNMSFTISHNLEMYCIIELCTTAAVDLMQSETVDNVRKT